MVWLLGQIVQDDGGGGGETQGEVGDTAGDLHEVHGGFLGWVRGQGELYQVVRCMSRGVNFRVDCRPDEWYPWGG